MLMPRLGCLVTARLSCLVTARYVNAAAGPPSHGAVVLFSHGTVCQCRGWAVYSLRLSQIIDYTIHVVVFVLADA